MKHFSCLRLALVLACLAAFLTGCSRDPNVRKQKYYESGERYFAKGKYREAMIQYRNATDVDSAFAAAHYQLAQTYLKLQDYQRAYAELGRTLELQPENYKAHADIANLIIANGEADSLSRAQEHTDLLLEKDPNNPDSHITAANLLAKRAKYTEAIAEIQKAITLAPDRADSYLSLAVVQFQANLPDAAEANFKKAIALNPKATNPRMVLAAFYQSRRRYAEAEQLVQQVIADDPKDTDSRASLARLYMSEGKRAEAETFLKQVKQEFPDQSAGYRMLGDFYFAVGDIDKATAEYDAIYRDHPKDPQVQKNYIQLLILKDRIDEAKKINEAILKSNPKDDTALTYRGEIQLRQGKVSDAVQTLQAVVTTSPGMAIAHYQLGLALSQAGDLDRAGTEWREAARLDPSMVEAQRLLAVYAIQKSDMTALEDAASRIIALQPASPEGYAMRAISMMARKQFPGAEQDSRKAIEVAPQSAAGYLQMANLRSLQHNFPEAEGWYRQALERDSNSIDALRGLINIYIAQKLPDKAVAATNQQIAISPKNSAFYDLLGAVLLNKKDYPGAEVAFKKAIELNKNNADAYLQLGRTQVATGNLDDALATCDAALRDNPKESAFYMVMGSVYEKRQDLGKAKSAYQKALELKPNDPFASNNLAYVLLQTNANPDMALQLAQTARRSLPELSNVADTLGWAFYQKGAYQSAIGMFEEAIKLAAKHKEPDSATFHYHLGLAYAKSEQPALAKQQLERVLKIDPKYSDADDVRKQLAQLKS